MWYSGTNLEPLKSAFAFLNEALLELEFFLFFKLFKWFFNRFFFHFFLSIKEINSNNKYKIGDLVWIYPTYYTSRMYYGYNNIVLDTKTKTKKTITTTTTRKQFSYF